MRREVSALNDKSPAGAGLLLGAGATGLEPATSGVTERGSAAQSPCKHVGLELSRSLSCHVFQAAAGRCEPHEPASRLVAGLDPGRHRRDCVVEVRQTHHRCSGPRSWRSQTRVISPKPAETSRRAKRSRIPDLVATQQERSEGCGGTCAVSANPRRSDLPAAGRRMRTLAVWTLACQSKAVRNTAASNAYLRREADVKLDDCSPSGASVLRARPGTPAHRRPAGAWRNARLASACAREVAAPAMRLRGHRER